MSSTTTTRTYAIDPVHSEIGFSVSHLMISKIRGNFTGFTGAVLFGDTDIPTEITGTVQTATVYSRDEKRDGHLRAPDFLDVESYPTMTFTSTSIGGTAKYLTIVGNLTMRGVTSTVKVAGEFGGRTVDPWGNDRIGISATGTLKLAEYCLTSGAGMLGEEVELTFHIEAVIPK